MEAAILAVYSAVAAVEVFSEEVIFDKLDGDARLVGRPKDLIETTARLLAGFDRKAEAHSDEVVEAVQEHSPSSEFVHARGNQHPSQGRGTCEGMGSPG